MLSARYLASCSDDLVKLLSELETEIVSDMARRFVKLGKVTESSEYQARILAEIGGLKEDVIKLLQKYDLPTQKAINKLFEEAVNLANANDLKAFNSARRNLSASKKQVLEATAEKLSSTGIVNSNKKVKEDIANGGAIKVYSGLQRLTMTIADSSSNEFVRIANKSYMQVSTGAFSYDYAIRHALKELANKGVYTVEYTDSGKTIKRSIESAVRTNVMTGINQTCSQITLNNCVDLDTQLVEVSAHLGARPEHAEWQGKIYSLTGKVYNSDGSLKYDDFYSICRLGEPTGICGINCRHSYYPYFEGTEREYSNGELDEMKDNLVTYKGEKITQYEAEQELRLFERAIRRYKREAEALKIGDKVLDGNNPDLIKAKANIRKYQQEAAALCKETGIRRDYLRETIGVKDK